MNIIETQNLTKTYGDFTAVSNLNLHIRKGSVYGFLGPNGAGKSTTMKMFLGLTHSDCGPAFRSTARPTPPTGCRFLKEVGSFIEAPAFYGNLTGEENLEIIRRILGLPKKQRFRRAGARRADAVSQTAGEKVFTRHEAAAWAGRRADRPAADPHPR